MGAAQAQPVCSSEDALAWEVQQPERHAYL